MSAPESSDLLRLSDRPLTTLKLIFVRAVTFPDSDDHVGRVSKAVAGHLGIETNWVKRIKSVIFKNGNPSQAFNCVMWTLPDPECSRTAGYISTRLFHSQPSLVLKSEDALRPKSGDTLLPTLKFMGGKLGSVSNTKTALVCVVDAHTIEQNVDVLRGMNFGDAFEQAASCIRDQFGVDVGDGVVVTFTGYDLTFMNSMPKIGMSLNVPVQAKIERLIPS